jgi:hypothetical protein
LHRNLRADRKEDRKDENRDGGDPIAFLPNTNGLHKASPKADAVSSGGRTLAA